MNLGIRISCTDHAKKQAYFSDLFLMPFTGLCFYATPIQSTRHAQQKFPLDYALDFHVTLLQIWWHANYAQSRSCPKIVEAFI